MAALILLVIDMLNDFFSLKPELASQRQQLTTATNELLEHFRQHNQPVVWIRQQFRSDLSDSFLEMRKQGIRITIEGTDGCEILPELNRLPIDTTIVKKRFSAFHGTNLDEYLGSFQTTTVVLAGINSHACVRMTAIDAYQRDYEVIIAEECVGSYDAAHHEITMRYLDGGIARVLKNDDILRLLEVE